MEDKKPSEERYMPFNYFSVCLYCGKEIDEDMHVNIEKQLQLAEKPLKEENALLHKRVKYLENEMNCILQDLKSIIEVINLPLYAKNDIKIIMERITYNAKKVKGNE